jgi:hypothetical protein
MDIFKLLFAAYGRFLSPVCVISEKSVPESRGYRPEYSDQHIIADSVLDGPMNVQALVLPCHEVRA